jgi:Putative beta-barrel porin 2
VGRNLSMLNKDSIVSRKFARLALIALFLIAWIPVSFAQEPPLNVSGGGQLAARDANAITVDGWLLYPTLRLYSLYTDNFFLSPVNALSVGGIGATPSLTAIWSNGIHTTTLYGNVDRQVYPTDNEVNSLTARAGFTQRYEAMRDLTFTFNGNFVHQTSTTGLQNSIQAPTAAPAITVLPNGNTVLPNGTILSPTGQPIGQTSAPAGSAVPLVVNPSDAFTGTFSVDKLFNRGILSLSTSLSRTNYENQGLQNLNQGTPNFTSSTYTERAAFWLGPLIYAYSNGSMGTFVTDAIPGSPQSSTTSYRVIGGLGTRSNELFSGSVYFGHQGSEGGGATAGGNVYGGVLSYRPTVDWAFAGTVDRTINIASQGSATTNLALTLPGQLAVQVPLGASTVITSVGLRSSHEITQQWFANCQLTYTRIEYVVSPRLDNTWVLDATLRYDIWRNMSLTWEYRYTTILSTAPLTSATSNYGIMAATYRF